MKKILFVLLVIQIFFVQASFAKVEVFTLSNGIKVLFDKTNKVEVTSMKVFTSVSVICEDERNAGISYLTSLLMEKSTVNRSNKLLSNNIDDIGARVSFDVDYDYAYLDISFLSQYFDKAAEILSDIVINPAFNEYELSTEMVNTIAKLNARRDSIHLTASDYFRRLYYQGTPYAFPVLGRIETISATTTQELKNWHAYSYNASNIIISVSGSLDKGVVKKSLEKYFSKIKSGKKYEEAFFNMEDPVQYNNEIDSKFNQTFIFLSFPAPSLKDKDFPALSVASVILGDKGLSSRLFYELREKAGLAYEVRSVYPATLENSYFAIYIGLDKSNVDLALKKIDEILDDFSSKEITKEELNNAKSYLKGRYFLSRQTTNNKSFVYGLREILGQGYKYDEAYLKEIEKVTTEDINRVANRVFNRRPVVVVLKPKRIVY